MRYAFVVIGTTAVAIFLLVVFFKMKIVEETAFFIEFCLWAVVAITLSKTALKKRMAGSIPIFSFREFVIILSIVFATICANVGSQALQLNLFDRTYKASYADHKQKSGPTEVQVHPSAAEKIAKMAFEVSAEEISSRWITLGALLMVMPAGWALFLSSLIFASLHTVIPILGGTPEIGLFRIASTFTIGVGTGIAFIRSGLLAAIIVHFLVNMVGLFAENHTYIADTVIFGSAFIAIIILPPTLLLTKKKKENAHKIISQIKKAGTLPG